MKFVWFIGIDVSKATLDVAVCQGESPKQFTYQQFANTPAGFEAAGKTIAGIML